MNTLDLLGRLVAFPTVSRDPNRALIDVVQDFLRARGFAVELFEAEGGRKANLLATIGPTDVPAVLLSGHTDVVPVDGQAWATDPFEMRVLGRQAFGRGTTDMKGFLACALRLADRAAGERLATPIQLAFSHDEEVGCLGVRSMLDAMASRTQRPRLVIVGEPTSMRVATGHKGKIAARAICCGVTGHSAQAPQALNAIHLACDFIQLVRDEQARIARDGVRDDGYDVPYTTLHVGHIDGGTALNIVPDRCTVDFEIRNVAQDDGRAIFGGLTAAAETVVARQRERFPQADIRVDLRNDYPGLVTSPDATVVRFVRELAASSDLLKVAFGTEGGLFADRLGVPVVVCGPGSMEQGHKPDEFIALDQLDACDRMMDRLLEACR